MHHASRSSASLPLTLLAALSACASSAAQAPASQPTAATPAASPQAGARPDAGMLRFPDVSATQIVFVYADDLWLVAREGGVARPLASPPGLETLPRFSPDGGSVAFVGNYDGNRDLYTLPVAGGIPTRVTHHPGGETLCNWTADGTLLFFTNAFAGRDRMVELFQVDAKGGLPRRMPVPYGAFGDLSGDGRWLAYTPHTTDNRTWKRYRGGMSTDIWLYDLNTKASRRATDFEGTDTAPMWHGGVLYYLSDDGPTHRLNLWRFDPANGQRRALTRYTDFDVKWPAIGPGSDGGGEIVFQHGAELTLLDLKSGQARAIDIVVPGARAKLRPRAVDAAAFLQGYELSPSGKRVLVTARGDVWSLPAKEGSPRNLTRSSGVAERDACWSPDNRWLAWLSDETGEYEIVIAPADASAAPRRLTQDGGMFRALLGWSPDSKWLVFSDKTGRMHLASAESGATREVYRDTWAGDLLRAMPSFSPDSRWMAFANTDERTGVSRLFVHDLVEGKTHALTEGMFDDGSPCFDRKGEHLYFRRRSNFDPMYGELDTTFLYANTEELYVATLRKDLPSPLAPKNDEEGDKKDDAKTDKPGASEAKPATDVAAASTDAKDAPVAASKPVEPVKFDVEGFERRAVRLPIDPGNFGALAVDADGALVFVRRGARNGSAEPRIERFDAFAEEPKVQTVASGFGGFTLSADGKRILALGEGGASLGKPEADAKLEKLSTAGMQVEIDPRAEWKQLFDDSWRLMRDFFYDPGMHGVDWKAVGAKYGALVADCASREDLSFVIREMISELNVGHAYYNGGDVGDEPRRNVGLLGCDFEVAEGAYRIAKIHEGAAWDADARGPLSQPGVDASVGDFLLEVNGAPLATAKDPWAAFQGMADRVVVLTLSKLPTLDASARRVAVRCLSSERDLRYRAWIESNRRRVHDATDGKVGYVYVPSTGIDGQNDLVRQMQGQLQRQALIVDERWNSGGQIPTRFIELLDRPVTNYWARRDGKDWTWPPDGHRGPKCMLINGLSGSGGDAFPFYFRQAGLGKLIGRRTWGGLVGLSGYPALIDGGDVEVPSFAFYERDGTWGIEGHGVDPDIEVLDDPAAMVDGKDPQLERGIAQMLEELRTQPYVAPNRPAYPDRSGMGLDPKDR